MAKINNLILPYDDFEMGNMIDPEQFDTNNHYIEIKMNEIVKVANDLLGYSTTGLTGAELLSMKPVPPFTEVTIQGFLNKIVEKLNSKLPSNSGSRFIGSEGIPGITGSTVYDQLVSLYATLVSERTKLATLRASFEAHNHDARYMTKAELAPYLTGGETTIHVDVFTILSVNQTNKTFTYKNNAGTVFTGPIGPNGEQTFTLSKTYMRDSNALRATVNDTLLRSVASGGLSEIDDNKVMLTYPEGVDAEITVEYFQRMGLAGEYSVIYGTNQPPPSTVPKLWFRVV